MLDDLRNSASSSFIEEESPPPEEVVNTKPKKEGNFLGMTASQRFFIVLFLFMMTCIFGAFCLLLFEKVVPPFF
jgi:hypothetical protein